MKYNIIVGKGRRKEEKKREKERDLEVLVS